MSGLELLPKAKAARPDVPVIMITAYGDDETGRKALEGGAEALLTKPIDLLRFAVRLIAGCKPRSIEPMPAVGQFRKSALATAMSAFPPLATRQRTSMEVRFVPILLQKSKIDQPQKSRENRI
jgi:CheY-like chemotaxis protein